jgi:chromosome segregation ATPase
VAGLRGDLAAAAERATMAQEESWQRLHSALTQLDAQRLALQQQFDLERAAMERAQKSELIGLRNDIVDLQSNVEDGKRDKDRHNDRVRDLEEEMAAITRQRHDALQACHAEAAARQLCEEEKAALERVVERLTLALEDEKAKLTRHNRPLHIIYIPLTFICDNIVILSI